MELFFDTETTGLVQYGMGWERDYQRFPYIVSIAWDYKDKVKKYIVHQEGREVPEASTAIHGITTKIANSKKAVDFDKVMTEFLTDALDARYIIGHNVYFDISIVKANVLRYYGEKSVQARYIVKALDKDKRFDTMRIGHKLVGGRWPKLGALYEKLFDEELENAHGAEADMLACKRCFKELVKLKLIKV